VSEKKLVVDTLNFNYEGVFSVLELYKEINHWLYERGYSLFEKKNSENITSTGRNIEFELRPYKSITNYAKNEIRIKIFMTDIKDLEVEKEKIKKKLNEGSVEIIFDGYVETDYENRWENKPFFYFFRSLIDKFVYRIYTDKFENMIVSDIYTIHTRIKTFLNLYRY
tara:strand:- start:19 stop:519 length:501 start_codon:yes stop_codon:yes gene_type:complete